MPTETPRRSSIESLIGLPLSAVQGSVATGEKIQEIPLTQIAPNPAQPRTEFPEDTLQELADSIKVNGLLEPIVVRPANPSAKLAPGGESINFEIVAGERRFRAHKLLGQPSIKAVVKEVSDKDMRLLALLENLQREDLSVLDRGRGVVQLAEELGGVEEAAAKLGMSRRSAFRYAKIGRAAEEVLNIIRTNKLDLWSCELLVTLEEESQKGGKRDLFLKAALATGKDRSSLETIGRNILGEKAAPAPAGEKEIDEKPSANLAQPTTPYWTKGDRSGLSLELTKGKPLSIKDKKTFSFAAQKFFREAGAKKVDIRF